MKRFSWLYDTNNEDIHCTVAEFAQRNVFGNCELKEAPDKFIEKYGSFDSIKECLTDAFEMTSIYGIEQRPVIVIDFERDEIMRFQPHTYVCYDCVESFRSKSNSNSKLQFQFVKIKRK